MLACSVAIGLFTKIMKKVPTAEEIENLHSTVTQMYTEQRRAPPEQPIDVLRDLTCTAHVREIFDVSDRAVEAVTQPHAFISRVKFFKELKKHKVIVVPSIGCLMHFKNKFYIAPNDTRQITKQTRKQVKSLFQDQTRLSCIIIKRRPTDAKTAAQKPESV